MSGFERRVRDVEEEIRWLPRERAYIFDIDGSIVFRAEGREDTVFIPGSLASGRLVIHNHPNGESLSRRDVQVLLDAQAAEFRVITERYHFRLRLPQGVRWRDIEGLVNEIHFEEMEELAAQIRGKALTGDEAGRQLLHRVWERVAQMLGWDYRREELDAWLSR